MSGNFKMSKFGLRITYLCELGKGSAYGGIKIDGYLAYELIGFQSTEIGWDLKSGKNCA